MVTMRVLKLPNWKNLLSHFGHPVHCFQGYVSAGIFSCFSSQSIQTFLSGKQPLNWSSHLKMELSAYYLGLCMHACTHGTWDKLFHWSLIANSSHRFDDQKRTWHLSLCHSSHIRNSFSKVWVNVLRSWRCLLLFKCLSMSQLSNWPKTCLFRHHFPEFGWRTHSNRQWIWFWNCLSESSDTSDQEINRHDLDLKFK